MIKVFFAICARSGSARLPRGRSGPRPVRRPRVRPPAASASPQSALRAKRKRLLQTIDQQIRDSGIEVSSFAVLDDLHCLWHR